MAKSPVVRVTPPTKKDAESLKDFTAVLSRSLDDLYDSAHEHSLLTADPASTTGQVGDLKIVDTGSSVYLVVKTSRGWFKSSAFSAI